MESRPLIVRWELWLHGGAAMALMAAACYRVARGLLAGGSSWLSSIQELACILLLAGLVLAGTFVPGAAGRAVYAVVGGLSWLAALSMLPKMLWVQYPLGRTQITPFWLIFGGALLVLAVLLRLVMQRRWLGAMRGHGHNWTLNWAAGKPYYARLLAVRVLAGLGYRAQ